MEFRIADTFTDRLYKLSGQEQKVIKITAFDLQLNPASTGLRFHKLDRLLLKQLPPPIPHLPIKRRLP